MTIKNGKTVLKAVTIIKATYQKDESANVLDPVVWSKESFNLVREMVYLNGRLRGGVDKENALPVPENYGRESKTAGEQQISLSGYRLGKILGF